MGIMNLFNRKSSLINNVTKICGGLTAVISLTLGYFQWAQQSGGELTMMVNGQSVSGQDARQIAICVDSANTSYSFAGIYPIFYNPKKYSVHDFMLQYSVSSSNIQFEPVEQYSMSSIGNGAYVLRYNNDKLSPYESSVIPIRKFIIPVNGGEIDINAQASFDGADSLRHYKVAARFFVVPNRTTRNFDEWKILCQDVCNRNMTEADYDAYFVSSRYRSQDYQYNYALTASRKTSYNYTHSEVSTQAAQKSDNKKADNADKRQTARPAAATPAEQVQVPAAVKSANHQSLAAANRPVGLERYFESIRTDEYTSKDGVHMSGLKFSFRDEYLNDSVFVLILAEDTVSHKLNNTIWRIIRKGNSRAISYLLPQNEVVRGYDICALDDSICNNIEVSGDYVIRNNLNEPVAVAFYRVKNGSDSYSCTEIIAPKSHRSLWQNSENKVVAGSLRFLRVPQTYITEDLMPRKFTDGLWNVFILILGIGVAMILGFSIWFRIEEAFKDWKKYGWDKAKSTLTDKAEFLDFLSGMALVTGLGLAFVFIILLAVRCIEWYF